jgi:hypothetical protein
MTQEYPKEVIEEVERTTFVMREEIKEAEAAVDACYRRRARRAGLGELLPVGRPMTEKELDTISRAARGRDRGQGQEDEGDRADDPGRNGG